MVLGSLLRSRSGRSHVTLPVSTRLLQTDIHSFLGVLRFCLLGPMSLSFSCHCIRCTNHRREHSQENESHTLIGLFPRKECMSVWCSRVGTGSVTWLRPERLRRRLGFRGRCLKIRDVCTDFEPCFKILNLVSVHPKSIILGQMTNLCNLNMIFHVLVSHYRFVKIWNSPQFPAEFRNGQLVSTFKRYKRNLILVPDFYTLKERKGFFCANTKYKREIKRNCVKL